METDYNFWRDLLDTYQSLPDWLKFCWLVVPSGLLLVAGSGVSRLMRRAISPPAATPPSPPPPPRYRGALDDEGVLILEPLPPLEPSSLSSPSAPPGQLEDRRRIHT